MVLLYKQICTMDTETGTPTQPTKLQNEANLTQNFSTFADYTSSRLACTPAEQKTIPGTGPNATPPSPAQSYYQIPLMYNLGTNENRILSDFFLEACEMETGFGIQSKPGQSGRMEHSVMCRFDNTNDDHRRFIETIGSIHLGCAYILQALKGQVKLYNFNAANSQMAEATGLKNPVYRARDELTGDYVQGRAPSMFLKLFSRGKGPMAEQTLFTGLDGKAIPWTLLEGVEMKFIPLIHIKRMYIGGGKASIQMEVVSAVVTSVRARNTTTKQLSTIHRLQTERPELFDTVSAQLAKLSIERQNQMLGAPMSQSDQTNTDNQPTFAGIAPTGQRQPAQAQQPSYQQGGGLQPHMTQINPGITQGQHFMNQAPSPGQQFMNQAPPPGQQFMNLAPPPGQQFMNQAPPPGQPHQSAPGMATLPNIPPLGVSQYSMQDFTAGAPTRPVIPTTFPAAPTASGSPKQHIQLN